MATLSELPQPPGQAQTGTPMSYSDKMKLNLKSSERLKRKVLEITVDSQGNFKIDEVDVAKLMTQLGIDQRSHMEGFQICPGNSHNRTELCETSFQILPWTPTPYYVYNLYPVYIILYKWEGWIFKERKRIMRI